MNISSESMVSSALDNIFRLCSLSDGPSDDSFQLTLLSPLWCPSLSALCSCPSRLPPDPPLINILSLILCRASA